MSKTHKPSAAGPDQDQRQCPLIPSLPLSGVSSIEVHVTVEVNGKPQTFLLGSVAPDCTPEQLREEFGGGRFELVPKDANDRMLRDSRRELSVVGEPKWREYLEETISAEQIGGEDDEYGEDPSAKAMGFGGRRNQHGQHGVPGPGFPGMPGYPGAHGYPGYPGMGVPNPYGMPGFNPYFPSGFAGQAAPQNVQVGAQGSYAVDPRLPPQEVQQRLDFAHKSAQENQMLDKMFSMMMSVMSGQNKSRDPGEGDSMRNSAELQGRNRALQEQNEFLSSECNRLRRELDEANYKHRSEVNRLQSEIDNALTLARQRDQAAQQELSGLRIKQLALMEEIGMLRIRLKENSKGMDLEGVLNAAGPVLAPVVQGLMGGGAMQQPAQLQPGQAHQGQPIPNPSPVPSGEPGAGGGGFIP